MATASHTTLRSQVIPKTFLAQLLEAVDLVAIVGRVLSFDKRSGSDYFARCPFHQEDTASFSVSADKQFYYCFGCGVGGNAIDFIMRYERLPFLDAVEELAQQVGLTVPKREVERQGEATSADRSSLYRLLEQVAAYYHAQLMVHQSALFYLKTTRAIGETEIKQFCLGFAPAESQHLLAQFGHQRDAQAILLAAGLIIRTEDGRYYSRFRHRIMFPIYDQRGKVIGFGGRVLEDQHVPKYLNSPETPLFHKGRTLYGLHQMLAQHTQLAQCLVVEGYLDVIALWQHGICNVVATLGTATTPHHLQQLSRYTTEIVFCFDGDQAGRTAAKRALQTILPVLHDAIKIRFLFLPSGDDPDTFIRREGKTAFSTYLQQAIPLSQFFFTALGHEGEVHHIEHRAAVAMQALNFIRQIPSSLFQTLLLEELAARVHIDLATLRMYLRKQRTTQRETEHSPQSAPHEQQLIVTEPVIRRAIAYIFQQPQLVQHLPQPLPVLDSVGYDVLLVLIDTIQRFHITEMHVLSEYYRDHPDKATVDDCLRHEASPLIAGEHDVSWLVLQLTKLGYDVEINCLLKKAMQGTLSLVDKQRLAECIQKKKLLIKS